MRLGAAIALLMLVALIACTSQASKVHGSAQVGLVAAPTELRTQCKAAATRLGFPVGCPTLVPAIDHRPMGCPSTQGLAGFPPCTGPSVTTPVFFMDLNGFDVGPDYVGVDGKPVGHMTIAAEVHRDARPCFGTLIGTVALPKRNATEYRCTSDSLRVQREARHGEGAYVDHVLLVWTQDGVDYSVSAHGHTAVNLALITRLARSISTVAPGA